MNKQIEELALKVAVKHFRTYAYEAKSIFEGCFENFLAELAKQSEPVAIVADAYEDYEIVCPIHPEFIGDPLPVGTLLFTTPLPQADLVAEVEALNSLVEYHVTNQKDICEKIQTLRQQLSATQADNEGLVKALEDAIEGLEYLAPSSRETVRCKAAIAAHKARQGKEES